MYLNEHDGTIRTGVGPLPCHGEWDDMSRLLYMDEETTGAMSPSSLLPSRRRRHESSLTNGTNKATRCYYLFLKK